MKVTPTTLLAALIGCGVVTGAAAQAMPDLKFSGFGTIGAVHTNEENADFIGTRLQPSGAGYTRSTSFNPDTKLGAQVAATFTDKLSGVIQVVSQNRADNSYDPKIEWANLKYQITPELSVRAGRIALPTFALSESRFVGYANPTVRPSEEVYFASPVTSSDGVDATFRNKIGSVNNALQVYYGSTKIQLPTSNAKGKAMWGISDTAEIGDLSVHAGYGSITLDLNSAAFNSLRSGLVGLSAVPGPVGTRAAELAGIYQLGDIKLGTLSVGATYDPGTWYVSGEVFKVSGESIFPDNRVAWSTLAGYRIGTWTPYIGFAKTTTAHNSQAGVTPAAGPATALNGVVAGLNGALTGLASEQKTVTAGVRWDFMKNVALKAQYDRVTTSSTTSGMLINAKPGFRRGEAVNVFSVAVDFVF